MPVRRVIAWKYSNPIGKRWRVWSSFSHVLVFWWADRNDQAALRETTLVDLPYAPGLRKGVFACRSERRPNPLALTTCYIIQVDVEKGLVMLPWIDALDGTPPA